MAFSWVISQIDCIPSIDGMNKVINVIHWRAQKAHQINAENYYTADIYGALKLESPHQASFIPYEEVTKEIVEGWLIKGLDNESIQINLDSQIENYLNPPVVAYPLPWEGSEKI